MAQTDHRQRLAKVWYDTIQNSCVNKRVRIPFVTRHPLIEFALNLAFLLLLFRFILENRMLNDEQQAAVGMSLRARDYLLIEGTVIKCIDLKRIFWLVGLYNKAYFLHLAIAD